MAQSATPPEIYVESFVLRADFYLFEWAKGKALCRKNFFCLESDTIRFLMELYSCKGFRKKTGAKAGKAQLCVKKRKLCATEKALWHKVPEKISEKAEFLKCWLAALAQKRFF